jgi:hypothetical protein
MRSLALLAFFLVLVACAPTESHGVTAKQYRGGVEMTFINATPEKLCGLYISYDNDPEYGDNWLPVDGLPVGKSVDFTIKEGTYKARWNNCHDARDTPTVNYAATLVGETAIFVDQPVQLYAFVSDGTPPTKRAVPKRNLKMVKFIGQSTEIAALK